MTVTPAYMFVAQFKKNCPHVRLLRDETVELERLFSVAQTESANHGRQMVIDSVKAIK